MRRIWIAICLFAFNRLSSFDRLVVLKALTEKI